MSNWKHPGRGGDEMPTTIHLTRIAKSPLGPLLVAGTSSGIVRVHLDDDEERMKDALRKPYGAATFRRGNRLTTEAGRLIRHYLTGGPAPEGLPLVLPERGWFPRVWAHLRRIPVGEVRTYRAVARGLRKHNAARAVGQACGRNPVPLLVPCHRVVASDGTLGGFTGGLDKKRFLLDLEGCTYGR